MKCPEGGDCFDVHCTSSGECQNLLNVLTYAPEKSPVELGLDAIDEDERG